MSWQTAETIADALLYEGYLLYPYRASALKNQYRWQFGVVVPREYSEQGATEPWFMQTECLLETADQPALEVKIRFLQVEARRVERQLPDGTWQTVANLTVGDSELVSWDEATPRELILSALPLAVVPWSETRRFDVDGGTDVQEVRGAEGTVARVVRQRLPLACVVRVEAEPAGSLRRLRVRIENHTSCSAADCPDRPTALRRSLISAHTLLAVTDGAFVSMLEPPADAAPLVAQCRNVNTWPVLLGTAPRRDLMLSTPIILYDYPAVAPESPGDHFDGTEIDELLTLSLSALTDEERRQARATDPRGARVLDRAIALPRAHLERLHGAVRRFEPVARPQQPQAALEQWLNPLSSDAGGTLDARGRAIRKGCRVILRPDRRADAMDMFLTGRTATVAAVHRDVDDQTHVAVTVDAAGADDLHEAVGRFFYFEPREIEVVADAPAEEAATNAQARVLIAGIGNVFLGDDAFGSAVAQRLTTRALPEGVRVEDFGIRSVHLAYDLLDASYDTTIIIDAVSRGGAPGTLYVIEPEVDERPLAPHDAHTIDVETVLTHLKGMGGNPGKVLIIGCEAASVAPGMGLSDAVAAAVPSATDLVCELIAKRGA